MRDEIERAAVLSLLAIFVSPAICGHHVSPDSPEVVVGTSIRLALDPIAMQKITKYLVYSPCFDKVYSPLDVNYKEPMVVNKKHPERITWFDRAKIVISNITVRSRGEWEFFDEDNNVKFASAHFTVLLPPPAASSVTAALGSKAVVDCSLGGRIKPRYCWIFDNRGEVVSENCRLTVEPVRRDSLGKWRCRMGVANAIVDHDVLLKTAHGGDCAEGRTIGGNASTELRCTVTDPAFSVKWCRALTPAGRYFQLVPGFFHGRYSSAATNFSLKRCTVEIRMPLEPGEDVGRWRVDAGEASDFFTGCFFDVPEGEAATPEPDLGERNRTVASGAPVALKCSVPWPIDYCYLRSPDGELFYANSTFAGCRLRAGLCETTAPPNATRGGRWACGVSSQNSSEDVLFPTNVIVASDGLEMRIASEGPPQIGSPLTLACASSDERPMTSCRFASPTGRAFPARQGGLDRGECALRLPALERDHLGTWKCTATLVAQSSPRERVATLDVLLESEPESAESPVNVPMLIMIGVAAAVAAIVFCDVYKIRRISNNYKTSEAFDRRRT